LTAFIKDGSVVATFELFTQEWLRNPLRVQAAQEARRFAGIAGGRASAQASAAHARVATLGVRSHVTGLPNSMGMNIAVSAKRLQQDADDLVITADNKVQADRGTAGFFSARASDARTATLGVRSHVCVALFLLNRYWLIVTVPGSFLKAGDLGWPDPHPPP